MPVTNPVIDGVEINKYLKRRRGPLPEIGHRWGKLVFTGVIGITYYSRTRLIERQPCLQCACDCGKTTFIQETHLNSGCTRSCGCLVVETNVRRLKGNLRYRENCKKYPLYKVWVSMKGRCKSTRDGSKSFKNYTSRGIYVCPEWEQFGPFEEWAWSNGYQRGLTIDRIDNDGPYSPGNCRWVTKLVQNRNQRRTVMITAWGETKPLTEWMESPYVTIDKNTFLYRISHGMSNEDALSTPSRNGRRKKPSIGG